MWRLVAIAALLAWVPRSLAVETMRIEISEGGEEATVSGEGLSFGGDAEEGTFTPVRASRAVVRQSGERLTLNGSPVMGDAIRFRAGEWAQDAGVPGLEPIHVSGLSLRGDLVVRRSRGRLQLINVIPLEDYLTGVLGSEMPRSFPPEALKAQAVAARTYALHKKLEALDRPAHLGRSVISQVYGGLRAEDPRTRAAVSATRGEVLTFELAPIEAYFHSSCGGRTETGIEALHRDLPYLKSVACPCGDLPASRWALSVQAADLRSALGRAGTMAIVSRSPSGRARQLQVDAQRVDATSFREKLGYGRVKSLSFDIERKGGGGYHLVGRGFGHGAGMCQWGAKVYADQGWGYRQILAHYYPGTELQTLY